VLARLRLLAVLLLVAIPLQGIASTTRALCHHLGGESNAVSASAAHHGVPHTDGLDTRHHHAGVHGTHEHGRPADTFDAVSFTAVAIDGASHPLAVDHGTCARCAACSVGAALPAAVLTVPAIAAPQSPFALATVVALCRPFDGPERPPRAL
jgi:hypothetical protein